MALQLGALYQALLNPGDKELAAKAAEEVASYEARLADIRSDLTVLKWMVATAVAIMLGNLWLTMNVLSRLPR